MPSIYWGDHGFHLMRLVGDMYKKTEFTDCALDTQGGLIHGHKTILVACSPYLQKLFRDHHGMKIIPLKEVNFKDMKLILDFIYCGEIDVPLTDMGSLRQSAELLQISSLQSAFQNFLDTFSSKDIDEGGGGNSETRFGLNFMKHTEREAYLPVNRSVGSQDLHQNTELGIFPGCQNIHQRSSGCGNKPCCDAKSLSKEAIEHESDISFTNTRVIKMETVNNDRENVQDELPPLSFVSVPPVLLKSEDLGDQESESCVTDPLLTNPLEIHPNDSNVFEVKNIIKERSETKIVIKQETEVSASDFKVTENDAIIKGIKSISYLDVAHLGIDIKHSCDELTTNVEGNMFLATEHVSDIDGNQNITPCIAVSSSCSEDRNLEKRQDLEVQFESISVSDMKEEKPCLTELDVENTVDSEAFSMKQGNEKSCIVSMQDVNRELGVTSTSKVKLKNAVVVLQRINLPYQVEAGIDKSGKAHEISSFEMEFGR